MQQGDGNCNVLLLSDILINKQEGTIIMALRALVQRRWAVLVPLTLLTALWAFGQEKTEGLKLGAAAPDFTLSNSEGKTVSLKDFRGKKQVALVFYPALFKAGG